MVQFSGHCQTLPIFVSFVPRCFDQIKVNSITYNYRLYLDCTGLNTAAFPQMTLDARHEKTDLKVFVDVIPKEGWARVDGRAWYDTDFSEFESFDFIDDIL